MSGFVTDYPERPEHDRRQIPDEDPLIAAVETMMSMPMDGGGWISGPCQPSTEAQR